MTCSRGSKVYRVVKKLTNPNPYEEYPYVITSLTFPEGNVCQAYGAYGIQIGCERAGCDAPEYTFIKNHVQGEDTKIEHVKARYSGFFDGWHRISIFCETDHPEAVIVVEPIDITLERSILASLKRAEFIDGNNKEDIYLSKKYEFCHSKLSDAWEEFRVKILNNKK